MRVRWVVVGGKNIQPGLHLANVPRIGRNVCVALAYLP